MAGSTTNTAKKKKMNNKDFALAVLIAFALTLLALEYFDVLM